MMQYKVSGEVDLLKGMATVVDDLKAHAARAEQLAIRLVLLALF
jgi:hypothetical protein